jgi:hypothetical protein
LVEELIVKAQARKESSLEIHGLPGAEETTERPQLRQHTLTSVEDSKLPPVRYGDTRQFSTSTRSPHGLDLTPAFERHYSVRELAKLWNLSDRMFVREPGVVEWGACERRMKRAYKTLRIPESVARSVYRRLRKAS